MIPQPRRVCFCAGPFAGRCLVHGSDFLLPGEIITTHIVAHTHLAFPVYWAVFNTLHSLTPTRNPEALLFRFIAKEIESSQGQVPPPSGARNPAPPDLLAALPQTPLQARRAWPRSGLTADVSLLEIPAPGDQGLQNKSSHRRKKCPAWLWLWRAGSDFNHTAGEVISPGLVAEGL